MAVYQITGPDGGVYEIEAPDSASESDVLAYAQQQFSASQEATNKEAKAVGQKYRQVFEPSTASKVARGALMQAQAIGEGLNFLPLMATEGLYQGANAVRGLFDLEPVQTPMQAIDAQKQRLGTAPQSSAERVLVALGQGAGAGGGTAATLGAAANATNSLTARALLGNLAERPGLQAVSGAAGSASAQMAKEGGAPVPVQIAAGVAGGLLPGAVASAGNAARRQVTESRARPILESRIKASGMTPSGLANDISRGQVPGEMSKPLSDLTGAVVRRSPEAAAKADALAETRKAARSGELIKRIESDIAGTDMTALQADDLLVQMERDAKPLYDAAFENAPQIVIPKELLARDSVKAAYVKAQALAKEKGVSLPDMRPNAVQPIPPLTLKQADFLKRAMDDVLFRAKSPLEGTGKSMAGAMTDTRMELVRAIDDQAGPAYAAARAKFAGPAEAREALELGSTGKMTAEEISRYLANPKLSEFERQAFRIGQAGAAKQRIADASDVRESASLFASPDRQQALGQLSTVNPPYLPELVRQQRQQAKFEQGLLGGSQTQPRRAADEGLADEMVDPDFSLKQWLLDKTIGAARDKVVLRNKATVEDLAKFLLNQDANETARLLRMMELEQALPKRTSRYLLPSAIGSAAGTMAERPLMLPRD